MARINSNVGAITAQRNLATSYRQLNTTLEHLSTGLRISRGKDDPAGLIVSERLRSEISAVNKAISNTQRAKTIIATTEGALDEVSALLRDIQGLVVEAANKGALSDDEIRANQLQIDSAIASITRIANSTTFAGRQLLNGSLDYRVSGLQTAAIADVDVHGAQFGTRTSIPVSVQVLQPAERAEVFFPTSTIPATVTLEVQGTAGVTTLTLVSNTTAAQLVSAIQGVADATGVSAVLSTPPSVRIMSREFGSKQFVTVRALSGSFSVESPLGSVVSSGRDSGRDATALINGSYSTADGNRLSVKTATTDLELLLTAGFASATTFSIVGGGALFQVGPEVNPNLQVNVGVPSVAASNLGNAELGFLSQLTQGGTFELKSEKFNEASRIVKEAIRQVAVMRGRLGAFERNTLDTNINQLGITAENLIASESSIRDADFAAETSELTRRQVLVNAGTSVLAIANQTPQQVLQLLGG